MADILTLDGKPATVEQLAPKVEPEAVQLEPEPVEGVVKQLRQALSDAREGKLRTVVIVGQFSDGSTVSAWSGYRTDALLGKLQRAVYLITKELVGQ
jgi:hypothetical protein